MKFGYFADKELPEYSGPESHELYRLNSHGYRCPEWHPMPDGKKNVAVLGCSHTYGQGLAEDEHWVHFLSQHNTTRLRYWNLAQPGSSGDRIVRTLYGCEKIIDPKIIIVCWPDWSRRERLSKDAINQSGSDLELKYEDEHTDKNNFLRNVFFVEKYAEHHDAKTFHCFAQDAYDEHISELLVLEEQTLRNCYPHWDKVTRPSFVGEPDVARDGQHYGVKHHKRFATLFLDKFANKLR